VGYLDGGDGSDELGGRLPRSRIGRGECAEGKLLDVLFDIGIQVEPPLLDLT
jgi:hypothetical protein